VARLEAELGEVATAGVPIVTLADFSAWRVETTDLTELDVVAVTNGLPVAVRIDALPGETLNGTVTDIARAASLTQGDVTYQVQVTLDAVADLPLRWGMTAFVDIETE
jgi:HlyD family secretion protein